MTLLGLLAELIVLDAPRCPATSKGSRVHLRAGQAGIDVVVECTSWICILVLPATICMMTLTWVMTLILVMMSTCALASSFVKP